MVDDMATTYDVEPDEDFGKRLRHRRMLLGYSQEELALISGKRNRQRLISRWEKGLTHAVTGPALREVAEALRVTPGYLLWGEEGET